MSIPSPRKRKIDSLRENVLRYSDQIQAMGVEIVEELGCSTQGCAYLTSDGQAAKITTDWDEIRFGQWLYMLQRSGETPKALPSISLVRMLKPGLFIIVREELGDLEFEHPFWFDDVISEGVYHLYQGFVAEVLGGTPYLTAFDGYVLAVNMFFKDVIDKANDAFYEDVWADDIDKAEEIWKAIQYLLSKRILICDILSENWGVREDGTIVVRDLGCNTAPILDASLYLPYSPRSNPDKDIRSLERASQIDPANKEDRDRYIHSLIRRGSPIYDFVVDDDMAEVRNLVNSLPFLVIDDADIQNISMDPPGLYVVGLDKYAQGAIRLKYKLKTRPAIWKGMHLPSPAHKKSYRMSFTVCIIYLDGDRPLVSIDVDSHWGSEKRVGYKRMVRIVTEELNKLFPLYQKTPFEELDRLLVEDGHLPPDKREFILTAHEERLIKEKVEGNLSDKEIIEQTTYNWPRLSSHMRRMRYTEGREHVLVRRVVAAILRQSPRIFGW